MQCHAPLGTDLAVLQAALLYLRSQQLPEQAAAPPALEASLGTAQETSTVQAPVASPPTGLAPTVLQAVASNSVANKSELQNSASLATGEDEDNARPGNCAPHSNSAEPTSDAAAAAARGSACAPRSPGFQPAATCAGLAPEAAAAGPAATPPRTPGSALVNSVQHGATPHSCRTFCSSPGMCCTVCMLCMGLRLLQDPQCSTLSCAPAAASGFTCAQCLQCCLVLHLTA